jgi:hypothetical protein
MNELVFEVRDAEEGGFWARALGQSILKLYSLGYSH